MMTQEFSATLTVVRAQIDEAVPAPRILAVTSAREDDGTQVLAHLLGKNFVDSGHATLVIEFTDIADNGVVPSRNMDIVELRRKVELTLADGDAFLPDFLRLYVQDSGVAWSHIVLKSLFGMLLERYQLIVINAANPLRVPLALMCVTMASNVLITLRKGRSVSVADRQLNDAIVSPSRILGVVAIEQNLIKNFVPDVAFPSMQNVPTIVGEHRPPQRLLEHS